ncbi:hyaluronan synthase/N-acetylglucosaminyltransferase [Nonomuraea fuscirosea]|uniref:Hyaluronan synthase/N-acetylglucosaminyltransferase n=1 Tax=Nonomuraea fuscirosea TaxID=1291556 RepID=A0A2T0NA26_9ACTN|nr:glycosyltransferase family 2 protein [Nonomuraea fuscirosea]PRX69638.1 hyaluronan synthase/N-acetylglucosaminyltransferase [Nonomuraea fuscirosea]
MAAPRKLTARYAGSGKLLVLGALAVAALAGWGVTRLAILTGTVGDRPYELPLVWLTASLLLWWLPLAWLERPVTVPPGARKRIDALRVTVQVPVYNEDPEALRACLRSVLTQSRPVNRVRVVDDGSALAGEPVSYDDVRRDFECEAMLRGIETTWDRTANRGKRFAQMHVLAEDDGDVFVTLDSDSVLDRHAVREGLAPFADPRVRSVAGQVLVLNRAAGLLARLTGVLYLPFTRGLRSAQSVLRRVTMNSGALAFYRADVVRACAGAYENECFRGRPMQMNDDSMLTFYASLSGRTVHQPSSMVFTLAPERFGHYAKQQLRWMRGTAVRHLWWLRYQPLTGPVFWTTVAEYLHLLLALAVPVVLVADPAYRGRLGELALAAAQVGVAMNYLMALRLFTVHRSDESAGARLLAFALAPLAAVWRSLVLRPMYVYALLTCRRVNRWGTRGSVEVSLSTAA